jgi:hypothetical protein
VTVERWRRSSKKTAYTIHESKDLRGGDLTQRDGIPCTSLIRTVIDLPAVEHRFRAEQALDHVCRIDIANLRLTKARFVEVARRGRNGTAAMRAMLSERLGEYIPPDSAFESMALRMCKRFGLPEPSKQVKIEDPATGFVAYLDLAWRRPMVAMECDSLAFHFGRHAHEHDRRKRRGAKRLGWNVLEFTYEEVRDTPELVAKELSAALAVAAR